MISTFAIAVAAFFAQAALASPLADTSLLPLSPTTLRARDPLQLALARGGVNASTAARAAPAALAARQEFPAHLLLCTAANCDNKMFTDSLRAHVDTGSSPIIIGPNHVLDDITSQPIQTFLDLLDPGNYNGYQMFPQQSNEVM